MENHPIPQDVTGFKFRLIGSVTLKQFLYLLGAGGVCLILYVLPLPVFVKFPLMAIPAIISLCLAFVPIDGRPMDKMIFNFLRALPSENEYIFRKIGVEMPFFAFSPPAHAANAHASDQRTTQKTILFNQLSRSYFNPDKDEVEGIAAISSLFEAGTTPAQGFTNRVINADAAPVPLPASPTSHEESLSKPFIKHEANSEILSQPVMPHEAVPPIASAPPTMPTKEPVQVISPIVPAQPPTLPPQQETQDAPAKAMPEPTTPAPSTAPRASYESPNVIEGVVRDARGKPLPHVIVEVINNATSIPVRTFRTNATGMFVSATAIPNGEYTLHMEDTLKKQDFIDHEIKVDGSVLPVIEITSTDQREKLRRELFGQTT